MERNVCVDGRHREFNGVHMMARQRVSESTPATCEVPGTLLYRSQQRMPHPYTSTAKRNRQRNRQRQASRTEPSRTHCDFAALSRRTEAHRNGNTLGTLLAAANARSGRVGQRIQNLSLTHCCCANSCASLGTISIWLRYEHESLSSPPRRFPATQGPGMGYCWWELDMVF